MRGAVLLACAATCLGACGRIGFSERGDVVGGDGGGGDTASDGPALVMWTHLAAYADTTCAERAGTVFCWGDNSMGQLGVAAGGSSTVPVPIGLPAGPIEDVSVGTDSACAVVVGALYCWGALGTPQPQPIDLGATVTHVSVGHSFQCAIAGDAVCWGANSIGQLGAGDTGPHSSPTAVLHTPPAYVAIRAGDDHACALDGAGKPFCWGHNDDGAIGASAGNSSSSPVPQDATVTSLPLIAGWHTCATTGASTISCWGEGDHGELGNGLTNNSSAPVAVTNLVAPTVFTTGGGPTDDDASCAVDGGAVKCWGNGFYGRLGQGNANPSTTPVTVVGLPAAPATELAIGYDHACAALADGSLWCWGRGDLGQLGDSKGVSSLAPVKVVGP